MLTTHSFDAQVLIIGGGPVGLGLAIELGQRGQRCIVVERHSQIPAIPKGQNLTQRTLEHFYFWGAEQQLRAARTIPPSYGIGGVTAYGTLLSGYHYDWLPRELVRPFYFTDNERLPQYATERVLRQRVDEIPAIEALYGWTATDITQDDGGTCVSIVQTDGKAERTLRAEYIVGCDGSRSTVRQAAAITQTRSDHDRLMVLLVFRSEGLHRLLERFPNKCFYNVLHPDLKGYWQFLGRVDLGSTWFFHAPVPSGTTTQNFDFLMYLHRAVGASFDATLDYVGFWDLRFAVADRYRNGRIFIAGDAAHSHPPYGGYGINTGLEDAANLGWKLAATLQGWAGSALLDSYEDERRSVFQSTARDFIEQSIRTDKSFLENFNPNVDKDTFEREWSGRSAGVPNEVNAFEPNYQGSSIVFGPRGSTSSAIGSHAFAARAGHHLAPRELLSRRNIYEELGQGFTLIELDACGSDTQKIKHAASKLGVPLKTISEVTPNSRDFYKTSAILVRPDQFVAWTSPCTNSDASDIIARVIGS